MTFIVNKHAGYTADGRRLYFKGGGGGDQAYYAGMERLYNEQADSARLLRTQAEANLPGAVSTYVDKVAGATNPARAERQAAMAGSDMASANAMERAATTRELASMGVNPNDARFAGSMRALETNNAARMAAGKNLARNEAEKYGLAVAQDAVGTFTGQSNSAASQMGGASSGLANLAAQKTQAQQQAAAQQSANVSNAVGGAMAVGSMFFKDGGEVRRLANGGTAEDEDLSYTLSPKANDLIRKGMQHTVAGQMFDSDGDGTSLMDKTVVGALFRKDGGEVPGRGLPFRPIEQHMLGGSAGKAQQATQSGFFQMQQVAPPPSVPSPQAPQQGVPMGQIVEGAKTAKRVKDAGGVKEAMQAKAAANTEKIGQVAGKFSDSAGNQIQSHASGMRMAGDGQQAKAAADAYRSAASQTADSATADAYLQTAANIEGGAGIEAGTSAGFEAATGINGAGAGAAAGEAAGAASTSAAFGAEAGSIGAATGTAAPGSAAALSAGVTSGATAGTALGAGAGTIGSAGVTGATLGAAGTGAAAATGTAAGTAAAGGLGAAAGALGAAMPWLGAAMVVGSLLGAWKNGGEIPGNEFSRAFNADDNSTQDLRDGSAVEGPGSHTDDIVPALLSAGEGVLNGEAMALETADGKSGKEVMEELNAEGLKLREQGVTPDEIRRGGYGLKNLMKAKEAA